MPGRTVRRRATRWPGLLVIVLVGVAIVELVVFSVSVDPYETQDRLDGAWDLLSGALVVTGGLAVLTWADRPWLAVTTPTGTFTLAWLADVQLTTAGALMPLVGVHLLAVRLPVRQAILAWAVAVSPHASIAVQRVTQEGQRLDDTPFLPFTALITAVAWAGRRRQLEAEAARRAAEAEVAAHQAPARERERAARDLHDLVAHGMSHLVLAATAARAAAGTDDATRLRVALGDLLERTEAEAEQLLARLHGANAGAPDTSMRERLTALVSDSRAAGARVTLDVHGDLDGLPEQLRDLVLRVVREGLTNAVRHAPGAAVRVHVEVADDEVRAAVTDSGASRAASALLAGGGHGLDGLREASRAVGGAVESGREGAGPGWVTLLRVSSTGPGHLVAGRPPRASLWWPTAAVLSIPLLLGAWLPAVVSRPGGPYRDLSARLLATAVALVAVVCIAAARRHPGQAVAALSAVYMAVLLLPVDLDLNAVAYTVGAVTVGVASAWPLHRMWVLIVLVLPVLAYCLQLQQPAVPKLLAVLSMILIVIVGLGVGVAARRAASAAGEHVRAKAAQQAAETAERRRIAAELADLLGRALPAVRARLGRADGGQDPAALLEVAALGRSALAEMRALVGALRALDEPATAPRPHQTTMVPAGAP